MYTRADISLEDRLEIFSQFWRYQDDHGFITQLSREWETSRNFIYSLAERVREAVDWQVPGRKAADRLEEEVDRLKQRVRELESACNDLSGQLEVERQDKRDRRLQLLLELALCPVSEDKIGRCLGAAFGTVPSGGWINEQINRAGEAALAVMQRAEVRGALSEAALDEVFMG
ncbi:MAG: hypothetical protein LC776_09375, partial [Acidobacteria bacterium]|nr:hypothetical protein [Acidobacteriota bacterium]